MRSDFSRRKFIAGLGVLAAAKGDSRRARSSHPTVSFNYQCSCETSQISIQNRRDQRRNFAGFRPRLRGRVAAVRNGVDGTLSRYPN